MSWGTEPDSQDEPVNEIAGAQHGRAEPSGACGLAGGASSFEYGDEVRVFDADVLNATWSEVRPGADYVPGSREAERAASLVRTEVYQHLKHRSDLDAVLAMVELDGSAHVWLKLSAPGALELVKVVQQGRQSSSARDDEAC